MHYPDTPDGELLEYVVTGIAQIPEDLVRRVAELRSDARVAGAFTDQLQPTRSAARRRPREMPSSNPITVSGTGGTFDAFNFWESVVEQETRVASSTNEVADDNDGEVATSAPTAPTKSLHERLSVVLDAFTYSRVVVEGDDGSQVSSIECQPIDLRLLTRSIDVEEVRSLSGYENVRQAIDVCVAKGLMRLSNGYVFLTPLGIEYHHQYHVEGREIASIVEAKKTALSQKLQEAALRSHAPTRTLSEEDEDYEGEEENDEDKNADEEPRLPTRLLSDDLF